MPAGPAVSPGGVAGLEGPGIFTQGGWLQLGYSRAHAESALEARIRTCIAVSPAGEPFRRQRWSPWVAVRAIDGVCRCPRRWRADPGG
jgi:hypothetical protein